MCSILSILASGFNHCVVWGNQVPKEHACFFIWTPHFETITIHIFIIALSGLAVHLNYRIGKKKKIKLSLNISLIDWQNSHTLQFIFQCGCFILQMVNKLNWTLATIKTIGQKKKQNYDFENNSKHIYSNY